MLVTNRLHRAIPVVDEVAAVEKVPLGMRAAVEVAEPGRRQQCVTGRVRDDVTVGVPFESDRLVGPQQSGHPQLTTRDQPMDVDADAHPGRTGPRGACRRHV